MIHIFLHNVSPFLHPLILYQNIPFILIVSLDNYLYSLDYVFSYPLTYSVLYNFIVFPLVYLHHFFLLAVLTSLFHHGVESFHISHPYLPTYFITSTYRKIPKFLCMFVSCLPFPFVRHVNSCSLLIFISI